MHWNWLILNLEAIHKVCHTLLTFALEYKSEQKIPKQNIHLSDVYGWVTEAHTGSHGRSA